VGWPALCVSEEEERKGGPAPTSNSSSRKKKRKGRGGCAGVFRFLLCTAVKKDGRKGRRGRLMHGHAFFSTSFPERRFGEEGGKKRCDRSKWTIHTNKEGKDEKKKEGCCGSSSLSGLDREREKKKNRKRGTPRPSGSGPVGRGGKRKKRTLSAPSSS